MKFYALFLAMLAVVAAGCIVTPGGSCSPPPHCVPDHFCPRVTQFAPQSDRFPYLDRNERWRLMSEPEFRERFHTAAD